MGPSKDQLINQAMLMSFMPIYLYVNLFSLSVSPFVHLFYLSVFLYHSASVHLSVCTLFTKLAFICLFVCLSILPSIHLSICRSIGRSIYFPGYSSICPSFIHFSHSLFLSVSIVICVPINALPLHCICIASQCLSCSCFHPISLQNTSLSLSLTFLSVCGSLVSLFGVLPSLWHVSFCFLSAHTHSVPLERMAPRRTAMVMTVLPHGGRPAMVMTSSKAGVGGCRDKREGRGEAEGRRRVLRLRFCL